MVATSGSSVQTFLTFAIVDELIRTLVDSGVLDRDQIAGLVGRAVVNMQGQTPGPFTDEAVRLAQQMLNEYR
jgi:hypothetical protein